METVQPIEEFQERKRSIGDILTTQVITVSPETPILEAVSFMHEHEISCLVVTEEKKPMGIFTEKDLVKMVRDGSHKESSEIKHVMTKPVLTVEIGLDIYEAYNQLLSNKARHLVVVNSRGEVSGVVTQSDILENLTMGYFVEAKMVLQVMSRKVVSVMKEDSLRETLTKMAKHSISCMVIEEDNRPIGILTGRDIARILHNGFEINGVLVKEVMSSPVISVSSDASLYDAYGMMGAKGIRRLVVVDKKGGMSGVITQSDIIKVLECKYTESLNTIISRLKKDIISNISHELKTPLTIIKASVQLARDNNSREEQEKLCRMALNAVESLNNIVEDFVTAAYNHAGLYRPNFTVLELKDILPEVITDMEMHAAKRNIAICVSIPKELPKVNGNPVALKRAFQNILSNAIKFSKENGGKVVVKVAKENSHIKTSISDGGIGIPDEKLSRIFEPLYQIDASTSRRYNGTGMGLAVAKSIVTSHGGRTWAESRLGGGTTIHFTLPVAN